LIIGISILFTINPGASSTRTGCLPSSLEIFITKSIVARDVVIPLMISTNSITGAGLKKCIPTIFSGRFVTNANSVIDKEDVLVASIAS